MTERRIAGHTFSDTPTGERCTCGILLCDILGAGREAIGQVGWAHAGCLTDEEYTQIEAEREARWQRASSV